MSCCGQKRAAVAKQATTRTSVQPYTRPTSAQTGVQPNETGTIALRYLGATALSLRGSNSGQTYYVDKAGAVVHVQHSDVEILIRTQLFTHIEGL